MRIIVVLFFITLLSACSKQTSIEDFDWHILKSPNTGYCYEMAVGKNLTGHAKNMGMSKVDCPPEMSQTTFLFEDNNYCDFPDPLMACYSESLNGPGFVVRLDDYGNIVEKWEFREYYNLN